MEANGSRREQTEKETVAFTLVVANNRRLFRLCRADQRLVSVDCVPM